MGGVHEMIQASRPEGERAKESQLMDTEAAGTTAGHGPNAGDQQLPVSVIADEHGFGLVGHQEAIARFLEVEGLESEPMDLRKAARLLARVFHEGRQSLTDSIR